MDERISAEDLVEESREQLLDGRIHDQLLDGILQGDVSAEVETAVIEATQNRLVEAVQMPLPGLAVQQPVTILDHPSGRAVRQASLAPKNSWRTGQKPGSQTQRLYYIADNGIEISLGTLENPLDLEEARKQIKKAGELTVLVDRLLLWFWLSRSRPRPGDGKTFIGRNGSVPVSIEEMLDMLGYTKHVKREYPGGEQKYTDGYRTEDKDRLTWNIALLSAFQVSSDSESGFGIRGAYMRYSLGFWGGVHAGYLISPGDWIHAVDMLEMPMLLHIDEQILRFDRQAEQHEIRLSLYLAEAFRDQLKRGMLGLPLMVTDQSGRERYITMEELLGEARIKIDKNNLTQRFAPRIEAALHNLVERNILAKAEPVSPLDKQKGYWGKAWCSQPMIIAAPPQLIEQYRLFQPLAQPARISGPAKGRKRTNKPKA
ncbi:hypothetical protein KDA_75970 [Dictyobacter alpinus]|uniref:Uncharacterized protein n=1 Tax=Dictyobacter alpinus TaxID=2014873 RepID=A0A402BL73_9CHLR|nr:hypothetical protein [Dictyobacter alpinus]GCE32113.1 hypothetical protein KDA_75970 [Dictyobacter alpinus]